jgi:hypothetical protein
MIIARFSVDESRQELKEFIRHKYLSAVTILRCAGLKADRTLGYVHLIDANCEQL